MNAPDIQAWRHHLQAIATPIEIDDDALHLGATEEPFLIGVNRRPPRSAPSSLPRDVLDDVLLWWAAVDDDVNIDAAWSAMPEEGPLIERDDYRTIETWTESELSSMHALWRLARRRNRPDWTARLSHARSWHLQHTQPDNGTNRPWALHVFLTANEPDATHYADTLLHNCRAVYGQPDPLSALILLDAANELEAP